MNRLLITLTLFALALPLLSPAPASAEDFAAVDYTLTAFDGAILQGCSVHPGESPVDPCAPPSPIRVLSASFAGDTRFLEARLDRYIPGDPCREHAAQYNSFLEIQSFDGISGTIIAMVDDRCEAKVLVDQKAETIRSFQPVP